MIRTMRSIFGAGALLAAFCTLATAAPAGPNILWITCEDMTRVWDASAIRMP